MARICQFSHSCFVLGRERYDAWQKCAEIAPVVAKRHWKYWKRERRYAISRCFSGCHEDGSAARLEYFQIEDSHREIGPDGYSEIVFAPDGTSLRIIDVWRTFSRWYTALLWPLTLPLHFCHSCKTVTFDAKNMKDAEKAFMHLFCATLFRRVYVQEIISRQGHVMKGKTAGLCTYMLLAMPSTEKTNTTFKKAHCIPNIASKILISYQRKI
jgi:hypothetical protein